MALTSPGVAQDHWAFVKPARPSIPAVPDRSSVSNPIDSFIVSKLVSEGLSLAPEADRATLLRRLSFDLIGLPPSPAEVEQFLGDSAPDAYERQVERLLASPHFGERSAQRWLDLARFAETDGFEFDQARPNAWRYRDWVIGALNGDMPYDRFVRLQLAGDEIAPADPSAFVATGFNRCYPDMVDLNDQGLRRNNALNDITETTGLVFLGLTIGCARCHDHKTDPIRQRDFYAIKAFFTPARFRDDYPLASPTAREQHETSKLPAERNAHSPHASGVDETGPAAPATYLWRRGEYGVRGPEVEPAFPRALCSSDAEAEAHPISTPRSTGRRTALADWLVRPDHPLTARVMVNRLWQRHFGRGLVASTSDFGTMGDEPAHPELLDWLATRFIDEGFSMKAITRLIVTSRTYRQTARRRDPACIAADPDNILFWRQNRRRLDGESIRDALLAVSGRLNSAMGGPSIFPELPAELKRLSSKGAVWPVSPRLEDRERRSIYVFVRRNLRYPFFEVFDRPDTNASCPQRPVTTIAPQALTLLNNPITHEAARMLALRVVREAGADRDHQLARMGVIVLGRAPDQEERRLLREFLSRQGSLTQLALALLNSNSFVYVD
jgi:hypothetical protein